jgi:hypothetical protein
VSRTGKPKHIYLGFDGAYVLSTRPLKVFDDGSGPFLATGHKLSCVDIQRTDGRAAFGHLRLKKFQVVKLKVVR